MEKVNKTWNGTAESAQSTPTHPWPTELHPRKLFVHACSERERLADRFAHSFSWKQMGSRLHAPYQRVLELGVHDATAQYDDDA